MLDLRGGTGGTGLLGGAAGVTLLLFRAAHGIDGLLGLASGASVGPLLLDCDDERKDTNGFFSIGGGGFKQLMLVLLLARTGLDFSVPAGLASLLKCVRNIDDGGEKSVSSRPSDSDFDVVDSELAL